MLCGAIVQLLYQYYADGDELPYPGTLSYCISGHDIRVPGEGLDILIAKNGIQTNGEAS